MPRYGRWTGSAWTSAPGSSPPPTTRSSQRRRQVIDRPRTACSTPCATWEPDMLKTTLAGLRAHKLRLVATGLAIVLGVGFVAGTLIFGDTVKAAMFDQFARA